jgi:arylsulfatase A-like enzyme
MPAVHSLLVAQGTTFANYLASTPGCCPSRASILRGQYAHNHGVLRSSGDLGGFDRFHDLGREQSTIATWLHDAGYRTALIGKYLNEYPKGVAPSYVPPGWDEWAGVTEEGYARFELNENGQRTRYGRQGRDGYSTDVFAAKAVTFVERTGPTGQPFFLYLAPRAPHGPAEPAPRHADAFAGVEAPRPPSFGEVDVSDKPIWVQAAPPPTAAQVAEVDQAFRNRLRTLLAVDELVARLLDALETTGVLEQTYIVFTSDNGYHLGEHRVFMDKGSPYEEAIRVPLVVRGPGVPAGRTLRALASHIDLAPTFAAWAGASVPGFVDGRSLAPLLFGEEPAASDWRWAVLVEHHAGNPTRTVNQPAFRVLRTETLAYVEYASEEQELYDLSTDPYELENLASVAEPNLLRTLSERLAALETCGGEACRVAEDTPALAPVVSAATTSRAP